MHYFKTTYECDLWDSEMAWGRSERLRNLRLRLDTRSDRGVYLSLLADNIEAPSGSDAWSQDLPSLSVLSPAGKCNNRGALAPLFIYLTRMLKTACLLHAHPGDPASKYGIPNVNRDLTNTSSPQTFDFIQPSRSVI